MMDESDVDRLCAQCGIDTAYADIWGHVHAASSTTKRAMLAAMGAPMHADAAQTAPIVPHMPAVAPRCFGGTGRAATERMFGPAVQLYALRSHRNWGIGDFTDLDRLIEIAAAHGTDLVGVNPLHALFPAVPRRRARTARPAARRSTRCTSMSRRSRSSRRASPHAIACCRQRSSAGSPTRARRRWSTIRASPRSSTASSSCCIAHFRERHANAPTARGLRLPRVSAARRRASAASCFVRGAWRVAASARSRASGHAGVAVGLS